MIQSLPVKLTLEELRSTANELAQACVEQEAIREEKAGIAKDYSDSLKVLTKKIGNLARTVREGQEFRDVECEERFFFETNTCEVWRLDIQERVHVRAMTAEEREREGQQSLLKGGMDIWLKEKQ